jgi:putative xylitol transport system permease protein
VTTSTARGGETFHETRRTRAGEFLADNGFLVFFVVWVVFLALASPYFLTSDNIILLLRQAAIFGIPAIGATFVVLVGELDLSFGSTMGLAGSVGASHRRRGRSWVGSGRLCRPAGVTSQWPPVTVVRIPSVVATLGMLGIVLGVGLVFTEGHSIYGPQLDPILPLAQGWIGPIPIPVIILFVAYAIAWIVLNMSRYGIHTFLVGDNPEAAYRAGISVKRIKSAAFILGGVTAGLGGMILVARVSQAQASLGSEALFPVLTAVILGGVSLRGGRGRIEYTLLASIFLASIVNGLILLGVPGDATHRPGRHLIAAPLNRLRDRR